MKYAMTLLIAMNVYCAEQKSTPIPIRRSLDSQRDNPDQRFVPEARPLQPFRSSSETRMRSASVAATHSGLPLSPPGLVPMPTSRFPLGPPPRPPRRSGSSWHELLPDISTASQTAHQVSSSAPKGSSVPQARRGHHRSRSRSTDDIRKVMAAAKAVPWKHTSKPPAPRTPYARNKLRRQRCGSKAFARHRAGSMSSPPSGLSASFGSSSSSSSSSRACSSSGSVQESIATSPRNAHEVMEALYQLDPPITTPEEIIDPSTCALHHSAKVDEQSEQERRIATMLQKSEENLRQSQRMLQEIGQATSNIFFILNEFETEQLPLALKAIQALDEKVESLKKTKEWIDYHKERFATIAQTQAENTVAIKRLLLAQAAVFERDLEEEKEKKERSRGRSMTSIFAPLSPRSSKDAIERKGASSSASGTSMLPSVAKHEASD